MGSDVPTTVKFVFAHCTLRVLKLQTAALCRKMWHASSVANSPGLTQSFRVSAFDLQALGVTLQSPGFAANCSCMNKNII